MSNGLTFLPMLGHDLKMSCTQLYENRKIDGEINGEIDGEIDEKHALQIIVS